MNRELSEKLYHDFPELYRGRSKPLTVSLMCFGFECRDGWFQLLYDLSSDLMRISAEAAIEPPEVVQVKEKYGGLRYYVDGGNNDTEHRIDQAEAESEYICEVCGQAGEIRSTGWIQTLCDEHYENRTGENGKEAVDTRH